jgi:hypothetical protein
VERRRRIRNGRGVRRESPVARSTGPFWRCRALPAACLAPGPSAVGPPTPGREAVNPRRRLAGPWRPDRQPMRPSFVRRHGARTFPFVVGPLERSAQAGHGTKRRSFPGSCHREPRCRVDGDEGPGPRLAAFLPTLFLVSSRRMRFLPQRRLADPVPPERGRPVRPGQFPWPDRAHVRSRQQVFQEPFFGEVAEWPKARVC